MGRMTAGVEFRREMNRNYMVIVPESGRNEKYAVRMLTGNKIPGFLPFHEKKVNGENRYYYDITSKQPLDRILEYKSLTGAELERMISDLIFSLKQIERFFLDESCIELRPELIYVEPDSFQCYFCFIPGMNGDFPKAFCELSQYLLDRVNHRDGDAVVLAFAVFRECRKENFGIEDIEKCLGKGEESTGREAEGGGEREKIRTEWERESAEREKGRTEREKSRAEREKGRTEREKDRTEREKGRTEREKGRAEREKGRAERERRRAEEADIRYNLSAMPTAEIADLHNVKTSEKSNEASWLMVLPVIGMVLLPAVVFFVWGMEGLLQYKWFLGAAELLLGAGLLLLTFGSKQDDRFPEAREEKGNDEEPWEVYFREEEDRLPGGIGKTVSEENIFGTYDRPGTEEEDDGFKTILLTARPIEQEARRLVSVNGNLEIPIGYFPFIIGKSKGMADFCLNEPGVSRLHVKIEESDTGYLVTDLNSTNGTRVNGELLEANETRSLPIGGELEIAARKFRFQ